jgi:hypothetical protein
MSLYAERQRQAYEQELHRKNLELERHPQKTFRGPTLG